MWLPLLVPKSAPKPWCEANLKAAHQLVWHFSVFKSHFSSSQKINRLKNCVCFTPRYCSNIPVAFSIGGVRVRRPINPYWMVNFAYNSSAKRSVITITDGVRISVHNCFFCWFSHHHFIVCSPWFLNTTTGAQTLRKPSCLKWYIEAVRKYVGRKC